jgi:imidazoleglycerol-phosphate dehydratase
MSRTASISRQTSESAIELYLNLDGSGKSEISTTVQFFDPMLTALSKH